MRLNFLSYAIIAILLALAAPAHASLVTVQSPQGIWENSTGTLYGFSPPGQNNVTAIAPLNANGGLSIGTSSAPPANGLLVQGVTNLTGNLNVATNKFNVTAASGNTAVAGTLNVTGLVTATAGVNAANNLTMTAANKGLVLKQGSNGKVGTFTCTSGGDITIANTSVAVSDLILVGLNTAGGTVSTAPAVKSVTASTGFHALCASGDTSVYNYGIINNAP